MCPFWAPPQATFLQEYHDHRVNSFDRREYYPSLVIGALHNTRQQTYHLRFFFPKAKDLLQSVIWSDEDVVNLDVGRRVESVEDGFDNVGWLQSVSGVCEEEVRFLVG